MFFLSSIMLVFIFLYSEIQNDKLIVVLEKGGEDLSTILKQLAKKQTRLPNYMLLFYWMEMLYAVKQIHMNGSSKLI